MGKGNSKSGFGPVPPGNRSGGGDKAGPGKGPSGGNQKGAAGQQMRRSQNKGGGK